MKNKTAEIEKKRYLRKIRHKMTVPPKYKKEYILDFEMKLDEFLQVSNATMQAAMQEFGTPKTVAEEYKRKIPPKDLNKYRWFSLVVKLLLLIILAIGVLLTVRYLTKEPGTLIESSPTEIIH